MSGDMVDDELIVARLGRAQFETPGCGLKIFVQAPGLFPEVRRVEPSPPVGPGDVRINHNDAAKIISMK